MRKREKVRNQEARWSEKFKRALKKRRKFWIKYLHSETVVRTLLLQDASLLVSQQACSLYKITTRAIHVTNKQTWNSIWSTIVPVLQSLSATNYIFSKLTIFVSCPSWLWLQVSWHSAVHVDVGLLALHPWKWSTTRNYIDCVYQMQFMDLIIWWHSNVFVICLYSFRGNSPLHWCNMTLSKDIQCNG